MGPFDLRCWELLEIKEARALANFLIGAHKFLVSNGAWQICWETGNELIEQRSLRLPFSEVVLEFSDDIPQSTSRIILLCREIQDIIAVVPFIKYHKTGWVGGLDYMLKLYQYVDRQSEWLAASAYGRIDAPDLLRGNQLIISDIMTATIAMIGISGTIFEDVEVPPQLAKAREKRGKVPLFSYQIVRLAGNRSRNDLGGTHASPALHWRRGHFRRIGAKLVPVAPCLVGSAENGIVEKSYDGRGLNYVIREERLAVR